MSSLTGRRKSISETELKEFEIQTQCLGWSTMKMLNTEFGEDSIYNLLIRKKNNSTDYNFTITIVCDKSGIIERLSIKAM